MTYGPQDQPPGWAVDEATDELSDKLADARQLVNEATDEDDRRKYQAELNYLVGLVLKNARVIANAEFERDLDEATGPRTLVEDVADLKEAMEFVGSMTVEDVEESYSRMTPEGQANFREAARTLSGVRTDILANLFTTP